MNWILFSLGFSLFVIGAIAAYATYKTKPKLNFWMVFLAGVITLIIAVYQMVDSNSQQVKNAAEQLKNAERQIEFEKAQRESADKIASQSEHIAKLSEKIAVDQTLLRNKAEQQLKTQAIIQHKTEEIAQLNKELRIKGDENTTRIVENVNNITGGDSLCYISIQPPWLWSGSNPLNYTAEDWKVNLIQEGKYPIYDIKLQMWNEATIKQTSRDLAERFYKEYRNNTLGSDSITDLTKDIWNSVRTIPITNIGILGIGQIEPIWKISPPSSDTERLDYVVNISTRNGKFKQFIKFRFVKGVWEQAIKVERWEKWHGGLVSTVYEYISPDFPLKKDEIQWSTYLSGVPPIF